MLGTEFYRVLALHTRDGNRELHTCTVPPKS